MPENIDSNVIKEKCEKINIKLTDSQFEKFSAFYSLLIESNKKMNLTAITAPEEVMDKHFIDSISIAGMIDLSEIKCIMDVGTGAGFPGIPLGILYPDINICMMDSLNKRILFIQDTIEKLGLTNCKAIHSRAEDLAHLKEYRESFDLCVSRAVASLNVLTEYCLPFVKVNGLFAAYKGGEPEDEISDAERSVRSLGGEIESVRKFMLPDTDINRSIVMIRKKKKTNDRYPRKAGTPKKEPL